MRAASLNYRDLMVLGGGYPRNDTPDVIPLSDGAGEVAEVGEGASGWSVGDRVVIAFMRDWADGEPTEAGLASSHGGGVDGVLAEFVRVPVDALVRLPDALSYAEGATLPCAGVTAWHGLRRCGVTAGSTVLTLGTGGVSAFAVQLARAMGARVGITSSADEKLEAAAGWGAEVRINYRAREDWDAGAREAFGGAVDAVIETGGPGTLERSLAACRPGGDVALIGVLTEASPSVVPVLLNAITLHGIYVGPTAMLAEVTAAVATNGIRPVIDRTFGFDEAQAAYDHLRGQRHAGKVVIEV